MNSNSDYSDKEKLISDESMSSKESDTATSTTSENQVIIAAASSSAAKRKVDESLLPAEEAERILARRAYNRDCATRARKRNKQMVDQLQKHVKSLQDDKDTLRRSLSTMERQIVQLEKENKSLLMKQMLLNRNNGLSTAVRSTPVSAAASLLSTSHQQQQYRSQFPMMNAKTTSTNGVDLAQLSRYIMNNQNKYY